VPSGVDLLKMKEIEVPSGVVVYDIQYNTHKWHNTGVAWCSFSQVCCSGVLFSGLLVPKFAMTDAWLLCQSRFREVHHRSVLGGSSRIHVIDRSINQ
jgi:hypothetical protein